MSKDKMSETMSSYHHRKPKNIVAYPRAMVPSFMQNFKNMSDTLQYPPGAYITPHTAKNES